MAKRTPAPKPTSAATAASVVPAPPLTPISSALVAPSPSLARPPAAAPRSLSEWMMVPTYLMLSIAFVPVAWLTGSKKAK